MDDHDPLCPFSDTFGAPCMYCALITRVRADERSNMDAYFASRSAEWEAKVRADQDDRECDHCTDLARLKIADLRAKVEALPHTNKCDTQDPVYAGRGKTMRCTCWQADVLALFEGGSE